MVMVMMVNGDGDGDSGGSGGDEDTTAFQYSLTHSFIHSLTSPQKTKKQTNLNPSC